MTGTVVALNAHPDDEALLTGGTLALLAAAGHRVVLVVATDGDLGLASPELCAVGLGTRRLAELEESAAALGAAEVIYLGHADSGHGDELLPDPPGRRRFVRVPVEEAAEQVAQILRREEAELLIGYDANGGYGHRDHIHVHHVARRAAELTGVRLVEATAPREPIQRVLRAVGLLYRFPNNFSPSDWDHAFTARADITHRVRVHAHIAAKRAAMLAHASQSTGGTEQGGRTLAAVLRLPHLVYRLALGQEYFREVGADHAPVRSDLFEASR
jgi:LmbE family N-acetylglucosaminyl deacetylase